MTNMTPQTPAEAVANGAQLLDEKLPGWWRHLDLETLKLSECDLCVCGQLGTRMLNFVGTIADWEPYEHTLSKIGLVWTETDVTHGFNIPDEISDSLVAKAMYRALEIEWRNVITARLQADALTSAEKKERVSA